MNISGKRQSYDSPCIGVCSTTNLGDAVCVGCGRTAEEVIGWNRLTKNDKEQIVKRILGADPSRFCPDRIWIDEAVLVDGYLSKDQDRQHFYFTGQTTIEEYGPDTFVCDSSENNCRPSSIDPASPNEQIIKAGT